MFLLIFYLFLALGVSFLCSIMEAVLLSTTSSFIHKKEIEGHKSAKRLKSQKKNIDRPLSAILTINTIAHTVGAAGVGAKATEIFGKAYFGIISAVLTLMILFVSEIIPKTIGANYWRKIALNSSKIISLMIIISYPLVIVSELITKVLSSGKKEEITRKEVAAMANLGFNQGILEQNETMIIQNLIKLKTIKAKNIMTPKDLMVSAPEEMKLIDFFHNNKLMSFSRIPVFKNTPDNITGYILKFDVLEKLAGDFFTTTLKDLLRPVSISNEDISVPDLFNKLLEEKEHINIITDKNGHTKGITTMEDIIETLIGFEILDETDNEQDIQQLAEKKRKIRSEKINRLIP